MKKINSGADFSQGRARVHSRECSEAAGPGIYVHVPFCVRKCLYCDFNSYSGCTDEQQKRYFEALYKEAELLFPGGKMSRIMNNAFGEGGSLAEKEASGDGGQRPEKRGDGGVYCDEYGEPADTLFIGGGTPSSVDPRYIARLAEKLPLAPGAEMSIECNPGTLSGEKLDIYRSAGFNRLSIGVQSFINSELKVLGRIHDASTAEKTIMEARRHGFDNINIDLMFGFPSQTMESWKETLGRALSFEPDHISFYSLQIEEGTPFHDMFRSGDLEQVSDELNRDMYHYAVNFLREHGYHHYEISNAALPGRECRHNLKYWTMAPYIGLGAGAHSFYGSTRRYNPSGLEEYCSMIERAYERRGGSVPYYINGAGEDDPAETDFSESENMDDLISDCMFTGLRLTDGIDDREFRRMFGIGLEERFGAQIRKYTSEGLMTFENGKLAFTKRGIDVSNSILIDFI
ncbi:MAG: radical SAM family heme chaperone HemW [Anaerovoracaceae bacterium]|jgi:oxygen-independent coproporphyrinogen-3 oxidase